MTMEERPEISIVVAAHNPAPALERCLDAIAREAGDDQRVEIVVAAATPDRSVAAVAGARPGIRVVELEPGAGVPRLRAAGLRLARGEVLALLEDHLRPAPGWLAVVRAAHRAAPDRVVVGGAVDPVDTGRAIDRAAYFCEYGWHMSPIAAGPARLLTGANASYRRAVLELFGDSLEAWETIWHERLASRGHELFAEPAMIVLHERRFSAGPFARERMTYGRDYAASRCAGMSAPERIGRALTAPLLPFVLVARLGASVMRKRRNRVAFATALPWTLLFFAAWSLGEAAGYVTGRGRA